LFPNQVAQLLGVGQVDYGQLRRLFRLVASGRTAGRRWTRFTLRDVAAIEVALRLAGGHDALEPGRHLTIKPVEDACRILRERYGLEEPLLEADLRREGSSIVATVRHVTFEPLTGQVLLDVKSKMRAFLTSPEAAAERGRVGQANSAVRVKKWLASCKAPRGVRLRIGAVR
jgi:hypothetical protein